MTGGDCLPDDPHDECINMAPVTTEMINFSDGATLSKNLPWRITRHCVTFINAKKAIIMGGTKSNHDSQGGYPKRSLIITFGGGDTITMERGPDLIGKGRFSHACASIRKDDGSIYVIAAGGSPGDVQPGQAHLATSEGLLNTVDDDEDWFPGDEMLDTNY